MCVNYFQNEMYVGQKGWGSRWKGEEKTHHQMWRPEEYEVGNK